MQVGLISDGIFVVHLESFFFGTVHNGTISPTPDFADKIPGLDNGQFLWSLVNLVQVMGRTKTCSADLTAAYSDYLNYLKKNVMIIFYNGLFT